VFEGVGRAEERQPAGDRGQRRDGRPHPFQLVGRQHAVGNGLQWHPRQAGRDPVEEQRRCHLHVADEQFRPVVQPQQVDSDLEQPGRLAPARRPAEQGQPPLRRVRRSLRRDFLLDLSDGFLYDCLDGRVRQADMPGYRRWAPDHFSGTPCVDELHLGHRTRLLAADPLGNFPVAFALVAANDRDHMRRFLGNLRHHGFCPRVVVTDGSNLGPALPAELRPDARHQWCVFHAPEDISAGVFDALRRLRRKLARKRGRPRRGGEARGGGSRQLRCLPAQDFSEGGPAERFGQRLVRQKCGDGGVRRGLLPEQSIDQSLGLGAQRRGLPPGLVADGQRRRVPEADRVVAGTGRQGVAGRAEGHRPDVADVAPQPDPAAWYGSRPVGEPGEWEIAPAMGKDYAALCEGLRGAAAGGAR